jgi:KUP system potassium uptake protein
MADKDVATSGGSHGEHGPLPALALGALGVVFGDIGTSPLYALKESFVGHHPLTVDSAHIYGVLSLIFWTMMLIVTVKYVFIVMRADNHGEGGSMALLALIGRRMDETRWTPTIAVLGVLATALFYGDAIITPAISVLSAVEGLTVVQAGLTPLVLPIAIVILIALFVIQSIGTAKVGALFGPVMAVYFLVLAVLGVTNILRHPEIVSIVNPWWALHFFQLDPKLAFLALGSVVLAVTGAEALYADMGHFGRRAISIAWLYAALPCLMLNYLGQGALLLDHPEAAQNPFFLLAPEWARLPLVILATLATVIASQAVISGAFSVTRQAVQLGFLPRLRILHTSASAAGQIYVPIINWTLLALVILLQFEPPGGGLWHRGHRHDGHHQLHDGRADIQRVALEPRAGGAGDRPVPGYRRRLFPVERDEDPGRWLVPAAGGSRVLPSADDLGNGAADHAQLSA